MAEETECRFEGLLNLPREQAFSLFVDRPGLWWASPFDVPDPGEIDAEIEPFAGGSCYEIDSKGHRRIWGTVLSIEDPLYVRLAWQVSLDGREIADPAAASRVMVNFRVAGDSTRLEIVHNEFLRHGENGAEYLNLMGRPDGWPRIIGNLREAARATGRR
ncbi:SRPBCC family protein [Roseibium marinum]|uniref:Uncharacterized protein YndB with AHSA1/START domain n=1 Tax=Roseibium marinum TaxID=281252 RepID=A0A2S3V504_9HYPH|nr:SRPBCC family protein [Roseibium marinum]POF34873.1 uncharacterized protein YndB with AHSA1/START domain [Roseibium marinum]